jgi:hypothetical protein
MTGKPIGVGVGVGVGVVDPLTITWVVAEAVPDELEAVSV